jgi:hypothetical protein
MRIRLRCVFNSTRHPISGGVYFIIFLALSLSATAQAQSWQYIAPMKHARGEHRAILLPNGKILVIGGRDESETLRSCELYNPTHLRQL